MGDLQVGRQPKVFSEKAELNSLFILENGAVNGGERHCFLQTNLSVKNLILISRGPQP